MSDLSGLLKEWHATEHGKRAKLYHQITALVLSPEFFSTLAQEPAGQSEANNMAGVAEQSGAGAPETSVRCGAPAASNTGKPVAYMTAYGFDNWMAGDGPESHVLMRGEGVGLPRVALYADARPVEWECLGRKQTLPEPGECNWPDCGCDPHATKVIESLVEQGWQPAVPAGSASPGVTGDVERMWCLACGTVTRDGMCDCSHPSDGEPSTQNLVNYADKLQADLSECLKDLRAAEVTIEQLTNLTHPTVKVSGDAAEWQPIETAPFDQEVLLGWWNVWPERSWEVAAGLYGSTKGGWRHGQATHWMSRPAPPDTPAQSNCEVGHG